MHRGAERKTFKPLWEKRLAAYGLSEQQIKQQGIQQIPGSDAPLAFDPDWDSRREWRAKQGVPQFQATTSSEPALLGGSGGRRSRLHSGVQPL